MQLFLGAVPIILRLFSKARGHLLFSNYSRNNLPKPTSDGNQEVGVITRQWPGLFETFFNFEARHTFGISCKLS